MFEVPDAKRVKRSKVFSSFSSSEDEANLDDSAEKAVEQSVKIEPKKKSKNKKALKDVDAGTQDRLTIEEQTKIDYGFDYEFVDKTQSVVNSSLQLLQPDQGDELATGINDNKPDAEEQTYAFNLFAPKPNSSSQILSSSTTTVSATHPNLSTQPTHITIRSPTPEPLSALDNLSEGGRILKPRSQSHYFTSNLPASTILTLQTQYANVATTGATIISRSTTSWPGTHLPWRIIHIPRNKLTLLDPSIIATTKATTISKTSNQHLNHRTRPSKKRRILKRKHTATREAARLATVLSDEAEREKRTRRNREKKVKKKLREKAKKAANAGTAGDGSVALATANVDDVSNSSE